MANLTDKAIRAGLKAAAETGKARKLSDGDGLHLECRPTGAGWWRLRYRFEGRPKMLGMGIYPVVGLADARERRDEARKLLAAGTDPSENRQAKKAAVRQEQEARAEVDKAIARGEPLPGSLEAVARQWLASRKEAWKGGTLDATTASLENHVFPELGEIAMKSIKPADVRRVVKAVEETGAAETAGRVFQRLRAICRYAIAHEIIETDPTYPLKPAEILKPRRTQHRAALSEKEAPAFLRKLRDYEGNPITKGALELLVLTAVRPGELRGIRWDEIDFERALWRIPAERMKMAAEHLVPLSRQALAAIKGMQPLTGSGELVFPSPFYPGKPLSENTLNSALARLGYKGIATAHGMRTLFSTAANEAGWRGDLIEKQLAHEERNEVRAAYNRAQHVAERVKLMQWWADRVDTLRDGAQVIPIRPAA
ncbi:MAG: tyrosine-type recombinase/integrase [Xenophilus sp.]